MNDDVQQAENEIGRQFNDADQVVAHAQQVDRSFIVKWVVYLYVASIGVTIAYLIGRGLWCHEDHFRDVSELIKIAIIPILTLVIGYYFGSSRR